MIGRSIVREEQIAKVTGRAKYSGDYYLQDSLHLRTRFSERPHARIRSIDVEAAAREPGVMAILTAEDVPVNRYGLIVADQPVLCDRVVRFVGDPIAAVVAETPQQAAHAVKLIHVDYEDLRVLSDPLLAMEADASRLHDGHSQNIAHRIKLRRGDVAAGLQRADLVFDNSYHTPMQEHAFLELEAGQAHFDPEGRLVVRAASQSVHDDQRQIACALGLDIDQVQVICGPVGGAFGGREDLSVQILLALAAWMLGRPVTTSWTRAESIRGHGKRHAATIHHRWGVRKDGRITAAEVDILLDAGAYMCTSSSVLEGMLSTCVGPYDIDNVRMDGEAVFTNNPPGAAFRGYGTPQTAFAAETHLNQIAKKLEIDPITIRERNCLRPGGQLPTRTPIPSPSDLHGLLEACADRSGCRKAKQGWQPPALAPQAGNARGFGLALAMKATGYGFGFPEGSEAKVVLHGGAEIEKAELYTAAIDVGQGAHTVLSQIAAHALGIDVERIAIHSADTSVNTEAGAAAASRLTYVAGNAVKSAAELALASWRDENRPAVGETRWVPPPTTSPDPETGHCIDNFSYSFCAQAAEVKVDLATGQVHLERVTAVQDVGRAINPKNVKGQIEGAIVQALGWTLLEDFQVHEGFVITDSLSTYLVPTVLDIPSATIAIPLETPDPHGPYGVRGVGEIPFIPLAPAITAAIHDATGIWFNHLPIKAAEILAALDDGRLPSTFELEGGARQVQAGNSEIRL